MKKYLLSLLVVGLSFIGFSNAINFSCEWSSSSNATCTPNQFMINEIIQNENILTSTITGNPNAKYSLIYRDSNRNMITFMCENNNCETNTSFDLYDYIDYPEDFETPFVKYTTVCADFENPDTVPTTEFCNSGNSGGNEGGGDTGGDGGDTGGNGSDLGLISHLTPAVNGLWDTVVELIPYIVYIGIGVLLFTLGFYAIRRLVNWLSGKINSNFKSKR